MSGGLVIRLRPHEKFVINGVVLENGDRRAKLRIKSQDANVLRMRDALHPNEATTPVKQLYYTTQLVVTGDLDGETTVPTLIQGLKDLYTALPDVDCRRCIEDIQSFVNAGEFYKAMKALKSLMPLEQKLLLIARAKDLNTASHQSA